MVIIKSLKVFYLDEDSKKKRVKFVKMLLEWIDGLNIIFIDEIRVDSTSNTREGTIRFSSKKKSNKIR